MERAINGRKRVRYLVGAGKMMKAGTGWQSYHQFDCLRAALRQLKRSGHGFQIDKRGSKTRRCKSECAYFNEGGRIYRNF